MNRRHFLQTMAALAAVAATASLPVEPAAAAPIPPNKYKEAIRLFDRCVAANSDSREVCRRMDELMVFLKENFEPPAITKENIALTRDLILTGKADIAGIRGIPPTVADEIYPIALMRMGLRDYSLKLDSGRMEQFDWFYKTYGELIISSC